MTSLSHSEGKGRAIVTNGKGKRTTSHLNLTRTLADVWAADPTYRPPAPRPARQIGSRFPFAGYDEDEKEWR